MTDENVNAGLAQQQGDNEIPHYQLPNFASMLHGYGNLEQDLIREAYNASNFTSLRNLPDVTKPGEITFKRQNDMLEVLKPTLTPAEVIKKRRAAASKNGLFHEFAYIPSRYSLEEEIRSSERLEAKEKMILVGQGRDFVCSSSKAKMKYEDTFEDSTYRYPYQSDPYDSTKDQDSRSKWIENSKILYGPFLPAGKTTDQPLGKPTRKMLPHIIKTLYKIIADDWEEYDFQVLATEDDCIAIRFELMSLGSSRGVQAYMNMLESTNHNIVEFGLKKVVHDWNVKPGDGYLYYIFSPPWRKFKK